MTTIYFANCLNYFCLLYQHLNDAFRLPMHCLLSPNTKRCAEQGQCTFQMHTLATCGMNGIIAEFFSPL